MPALPLARALLALALHWHWSGGGAASAFCVAPITCRARTSKRNEAAHKHHTTASAASTSSVEEAVSFRLPPDWRACNEWPADAAGILNEYGVVALMSADDTPGLIEDEICDNANAAATSRLRDMQRRIESRGLDPTGKDEMYRFSEIICRDEGGRRFDVPVAFLGDGAGEKKSMQSNVGSDRMGTPLQPNEEEATKKQSNVGSGRIGTPLQRPEEEAIQTLHEAIQTLVLPVIDRLWEDSERYASDVAAAGFLINEPGSSSQNWHRDGPDEGFIDCFVPLIDLAEELGPTAIKPCTHTYTGSVGTASADVLMPLLRKGEVLLFDYRTIHRGQGNRSESSRTLAYAVWKCLERGKQDAGDIHNFPAALTLEYD